MIFTRDKIYLLGALCLAIGMMTTVCFLYIYTKPNYEVIIDPRCSVLCRNELKTLCKNSTLSAHEMHKELLQLPYIKSVNMLRKSLCKILIFITAQTPVACINDRYMLCENGFFIERSLMDSQICMPMPMMNVACQLNKELGTMIIRWLAACDEILLESYKITWLCPSNIIISDKQRQDKKCLTHYNMILSHQLVNQGLELLDQALQQHKKKGAGLIADLRFKDQIIISKKRGDHEREII